MPAETTRGRGRPRGSTPPLRTVTVALDAPMLARLETVQAKLAAGALSWARVTRSAVARHVLDLGLAALEREASA